MFGWTGLQGKAKDAWMNRSAVEKPCDARWGMVAKHRIPLAGFKPKAVPEACAEMLSKEHLRNRQIQGNTKQIYKPYKAQKAKP